jgi:pimeloyl-ACP methyl ester carboxylesterase
MRGHGESDWAADGDYRVEAFAGDVIDVLSAIGGDLPPAVVGASLGGLSTWLAIGRAKEPPARAIALVDIVPGFRGSGVDAIRGFMAANPDGFASIDAAADAVAAYLPHRKRPTDTSGLARNLRQRENGRWYWHWDPQLMSGPLGLDVPRYREEMVAIARRMQLPVLLVRGSRSRVVTAEGVAIFRELVPHVRYVNVAGADHMGAGDANDAFNRPLVAFLQESAAG